MCHDDPGRRLREFGGRHVPEPLLEPLDRLAGAFDEIVPTDEFQSRFRHVLEQYAGRPTPLYHAANLSERYGAEIYLKREDLLHGGAHKINNCLALAKQLAEEGDHETIVVNLSGRGDKDMEQAAEMFDLG